MALQMSDFKLDATTGDLVVENGQLVRETDVAEVIAQRVRVRLRMWAGEWYRDRRAYMRYVDLILRKGASVQDVVGEVRTAVEAIPGVARMTAFEADYDRARRVFKGTLVKIELDSGQVVEV